MSNFEEKIKEKLLLKEEDIPLILQGNLKALHAQNKEAAIRVLIGYASLTLGLLFYLFIFSFFGFLGKTILSAFFFGSLSFLGFKLGKETLIKISSQKGFYAFIIFFFALMSWSMASNILSYGGFLAKAFLFLLIIGLIAGLHTFREKIEQKGITKVQMWITTLFLTSFLISFQTAVVQFAVDAQIEAIKYRSEIRRQKEAEKMRSNLATSKACTSDEECRKMNTKKNAYYEDYEEVAQETCEIAVAKQINDRFEWTLSQNDYKFTSYEIDVLNDTIILFGNNARLIKTGNEKQDLTYSCSYNTKTFATAVKVTPVTQ